MGANGKPEPEPACVNDPFKHKWKEVYYGYECELCGVFVAYGCEPWAPDEEEIRQMIRSTERNRDEQ